MQVRVYQRILLPACGRWKICAEYGSSRFLRNVGICLPNYTASYRRILFLQGRRREDGEQEKNKAGNVRIKVRLRRFSVTLIAMEKTCSVCMGETLVIQQAMRMRRIESIRVTSLTVLLFFFSYYLINGTIKKNILSVKCVFRFTLQISCKIFLILRRTERDIIINVQKPPVKYTFFMSELNNAWIFSTDFLKIFEYQISWKSIQWSRVVPRGRTETDRH